MLMIRKALTYVLVYTSHSLIMCWTILCGEVNDFNCTPTKRRPTAIRVTSLSHWIRVTRSEPPIRVTESPIRVTRFESPIRAIKSKSPDTSHLSESPNQITFPSNQPTFRQSRPTLSRPTLSLPVQVFLSESSRPSLPFPVF